MQQITIGGVEEAVAERDERDYYPTDPRCLRAFLERLDNFGYSVEGKRVLEPCAGRGNLVEVLRSFGAEVTAWDLHSYEHDNPADDIQWGVDFLSVEPPEEKYDLVLTNPPFGIFESIIRHSFEFGDEVVMLLRMSALGSQDRYPFWMEWLRGGPAPALGFQSVLVPRPSFTRDGGSDNSEYAWFGWPSPWGHPTIRCMPAFDWTWWKGVAP